MTDRVERLTMSVSEAAAELGISPKKAYELAHSADFPSFKIGTRKRKRPSVLLTRTGAKVKRKGAPFHLHFITKMEDLQ